MAINPANNAGIKALATAATGNGEALPSMQMRPATLISVDKATTPWTAEIEVQGGRYSGITMLGWYDPVPGDPIIIVNQGSEYFILGSLAPGKVYMPPAPPPAPPAPAAAPPAPLVTRSVPIEAVTSFTKPAESPYGGTRYDRLYQGGGSIAQRAYWCYGNRIAAAKGSGTIVSGSIFIKRMDISAGIGGAANVRLGSHGFEAEPGSSSPHWDATTVGALGKNVGGTFNIPQVMVDGMNSGGVKGFGLEPGQLGYLSADYLAAYAFGANQEWSGSLTLTIKG